MAEQSNQEIELRDLTHIGICNHQVPVSGLSDSCSVVSELPDLRNWFSSYVYESPELDSDDFGVSFSVIEGEYEERGLYAKDAETKGEEELPDFKTIRNNDHAAQEIYAARPVVGNTYDQHKELEGDISILASVIKYQPTGTNSTFGTNSNLTT
ncbi:hypothetical protein Nepgr_024634 [Nepenthes gracilis]|uniref:Uncharacterized protein n=1 Tax=Nepenthes gracilis TaxID=150966 RepID=A0AAD3T6B0_NEPGR|nr:hypothetical protein Nepgr_024634 [Nepenthes gracilis]